MHFKLYFRANGRKQIFPLRGADAEDSVSEIIQVGQQNSERRNNLNEYRVYDSCGLGPCLNKMEGGGREPNIAIPVLTPDRTEKRQNGRRFKDNGEEAFTLTAQDIHGVALQADKSVTIPVVWYEKYKCYIAIRKLTPRECFRLQGWTDDYFDKAQFVNSDSQLYKQAGNAITVTVMEDIAKALKEVENGQKKHTDR